MKVTVIKQYQDKYTGEKHFPGEVISVSAKRMAELAAKDVIDRLAIPEEPEAKVEEKAPEVAEEAPKKAKRTPRKRTAGKKG